MSRKNLIVIAEKSVTDGTYQLFRRLLGQEFSPTQIEYNFSSVYQQPATILYMNLSEMKYNDEYARLLLSRERDQLLSVICFEYCNPRMQEIDQNIRQLRDMRFDVDEIRFLFAMGETMSKVRNTVDEKRRLGMQASQFLESRSIDNMHEKIFILDDQLGLEMLVSSPSRTPTLEWQYPSGNDSQSLLNRRTANTPPLLRWILFAIFFLIFVAIFITLLFLFVFDKKPKIPVTTTPGRAASTGRPLTNEASQSLLSATRDTSSLQISILIAFLLHHFQFEILWFIIPILFSFTLFYFLL